jgi:hypothetical protein
MVLHVVLELGQRSESLLAALHLDTLDDAVVCSLVTLQVPLQIAGDVEASVTQMTLVQPNRVHRFPVH